MRHKFHPFERAVGLFLLTSIVGTLGFGIMIAVKKNWFEDKIYFFSHIHSASSIRAGNGVFMAGLRVGKIEEVDFDPEGRLTLKFSVLKKYAKTITQDSELQLTRPFVIGEKVLTIRRNEKSQKILPGNSFLSMPQNLDLMDVLSGDNINLLFGRLDTILKNLEDISHLSKTIALEVGEKNKIKKMMDNLTLATQELKKTPELMRQASAVMTHLNELSSELRALRPVIQTMARDVPEGSEKVIELIHESLTTVKAIQKNYFLKDHVEKVKKEQKSSSRSIAGGEKVPE